MGRGLEALLGRSLETQQQPTDQPAAPPADDKPVLVLRDPDQELEDELPEPAAGDERVTRDEEGQQWLRLDLVDRNPYQPRQTFDEAEIADLCDSIRTHGFLQPIVVRPDGE
ncbi:MAG: ParB N-terminal domain-containing protein, partial [Actinomycetota bacterium]